MTERVGGCAFGLVGAPLIRAALSSHEADILYRTTSGLQRELIVSRLEVAARRDDAIEILEQLLVNADSASMGWTPLARAINALSAMGPAGKVRWLGSAPIPTFAARTSAT